MYKRHKLPFRIGMDPEFWVYTRNNVPIGGGQIKNLAPHSYNLKGYTHFEFESGRRTIEFNPNPATEIYELLENFRNLLIQFKKRNPKAHKLIGRTLTAPLGGHIHLEIPRENESYYEENIRAIVNTLATHFLKLNSILNKNAQKNRLRIIPHYGKIYDFRVEKKDTNKTLEIRTLDSTWLETPQKAYATLAYLAALWHKIIKKKPTYNKQLYSNSFLQHLQKNLFSNQRNLPPKIIKALDKTCFNEIKKTELYKVYKAEINSLFTPPKEENPNLFVNWGVIKKEVPSQGNIKITSSEYPLLAKDEEKAINTKIKTKNNYIIDRTYRNNTWEIAKSPDDFSKMRKKILNEKTDTYLIFETPRGDIEKPLYKIIEDLEKTNNKK